LSEQIIETTLIIWVDDFNKMIPTYTIMFMHDRVCDLSKFKIFVHKIFFKSYEKFKNIILFADYIKFDP